MLWACNFLRTSLQQSNRNNAGYDFCVMFMLLRIGLYIGYSNKCSTIWIQSNSIIFPNTLVLASVLVQFTFAWIGSKTGTNQVFLFNLCTLWPSLTITELWPFGRTILKCYWSWASHTTFDSIWYAFSSEDCFCWGPSRLQVFRSLMYLTSKNHQFVQIYFWVNDTI